METARLLHEARAHMRRNDWRSAGACYYAAQLRLRTFATLAPHEREIAGMVSALHVTLGRPIDEWLGGDVRDWVGVIGGALRWDADHGFAELLPFAAQRGIALALAERTHRGSRKAVDAFAQTLLRRRAEVYAARRAAGLAVRDPQSRVVRHPYAAWVADVRVREQAAA